MMISLTELSKKTKIGFNILLVNVIEEYLNNTSKISLNNPDGTFNKYIYVKESVEEVCDAINKIKNNPNNHKIMVYYKKSRFDD